MAGRDDVVGFEVAAVSLLRPGDEFEVVAVAGDEEARKQLLGRRTALSHIEAEFADAEHWGSLLFQFAARPSGSSLTMA